MLLASRDYIRAVEALLRARPLTSQSKVRRADSFSAHAAGDEHRRSDPNPCLRLCPKGRRLSPARAGWLGSIGSPDSEAAAIADMRVAWSAEGRDPARLHATIVAAARYSTTASPPVVRRHARRPTAGGGVFHDLVETPGALFAGTAQDFRSQ